MPLSINTNLASMTAQRAFLNTNIALETAFERLSTGKRVNSSVDDAAGLAIGKDLESRVSGLNQAIRNTNDGISMVQIAEGTMDEVTTILQRMRDLAVQAASGSVSSTEQGYLDTEHSKLATSLGKALDQAKFNEQDLISDSSTTNLTLHTGSNASETTTISIAGLTEDLLKVSATTIALNGTSQSQETVNFGNISTQTNDGSGTGTYTLTLAGVTYTTASTITAATTSAAMKTALDTATDSQGNLVTTVGSFSATGGGGSDLVFTFTNNGNQTGTNSIAADHTSFDNSNITVSASNGAGKAEDAITIIDEALATVAKERATLGATQAQLESTVRNLSNVAENTAAAASRIMDTDYAAETANLTKAQILQQAATSILAQANAQPQAVLTLLQQ